MREGRIEAMRYLRNPLDVLAQQVVAAVAVDDWRADELLELVRRAAGFAELSDDVWAAVLDLLSGRYPSDEFNELRPRLVWDRLEGRLRAREGSRRLAVTSGGTIPDRGLFGVFLPDGTRVGELDEEMVYESRPGETFLLGASTWRIEDITFERVVVTPAPGQPGKMPFWHGDRPGRPLELGRAVGEAVRELRSLGPSEAVARLSERERLDPWAAANLVQYLSDQVDAAGAVPDDRTIVVERFRDEIGDWRMCVLTPFGTPVHAPWALALQHRLAERHDMAVEIMWSDDGIVLRLPEAVEHVPVEELLIEPEEIDEIVTAALPATALFASRFRECAARALLLPRRRPDQRTPLWQQRQRAADLLTVAARYPSFPILLEATRECLQDVFDVPALRDVLRELRSRRIRLVAVDTPRASPFAQSLLFNWIATYMYEGDAPLAERRAAALALDRDLLADLLGAEELRELLDPGALADLELDLQRLSDGRRARTADELHDVLRVVGDLSRAEVDIRTEAPAGDVAHFLEELVAARQAFVTTIAGEERFVAAEDAARYRDGLGVALPPGLPQVFTEPVPRPLEDVLARYGSTHGPFITEAPGRRFGIPVERVAGALRALEEAGRVVRGEFRPGGHEREWCDTDVLRQLRRRSLAVLRREVEPVPQEALARFLPGWQGVGSGRRGADALVDAIVGLQGAAVPASTLDDDVLAARVAGYRPGDLDALATAGEIVWIGAGGLGSSDGKVRLYFRDQLALLAGGVEPPEAPTGSVHDALRATLGQRGAVFWPELVQAASGATEAEVLAALWDLAWAGEATNDSFAPLRAAVGKAGARGGAAPRRAVGGRGRPRPVRLGRIVPEAGAGRWSLVAPLVEPSPPATAALHARALQLLERHGVVTREAVLAEGSAGGFSAVYPVLRALEERGQVRRGYFVTGLGAAQFALPGAVERLRDARGSDGDEAVPVVLSATDPGQPYGAALSWPEPRGTGRPARVASATVLLVDGAVAAWHDRRGHHLVTFEAAEPDDRWLAALVEQVKDGRWRSIEVRKIDGQPVMGDSVDAALVARLRSAGFAQGYRGLVLRS
jgi:ATP-dependent Lhr-like helicase